MHDDSSSPFNLDTVSKTDVFITLKKPKLKHAPKHSSYYCPECGEIPLLQTRDLVRANLLCKNNHRYELTAKNGKEIFEKMTEHHRLKCCECQRTGGDDMFYYCITDGNFTCTSDAESKIKKNPLNKLVKAEKKLIYCSLHKKEYIFYCFTHVRNCCIDCAATHKNCEIKNFTELMPDDIKVEYFTKLLCEHKEKIYEINSNFQKYMSELKCAYENWECNISSMINIYEIMVQAYTNLKYNYHILYNINELLKKLEELKGFRLDAFDWENFSTKNEINLTVDVLFEDTVIKNTKTSIPSNLYKKTYFLYDTENQRLEEKGQVVQSFAELNGENTDLYVDGVKTKFQKYFIFDTTGKHHVKLLFHDKVKSCRAMFSYCEHITSIDLSHFDTENVRDMSYMFSSCKSLKSVNFANTSTEKVTKMNGMFSGCLHLRELNLSSFATENVTTMAGMFVGCRELVTLNLSVFSTKNVLDMNNMFCYCAMLSSIDLSSFDTENVVDMSEMFSNCIKIASLNLKNFNTENVKDMSGMFSGCIKLKDVNLQSFRVENCCDMSDMFGGCENIAQLNMENFYTNKLVDCSRMFKFCKKLVYLNLQNFYVGNCKDFQELFLQCDSLTELIINRPSFEAVKKELGQDIAIYFV